MSKEYTMEYIADKRTVKGRIQYLVVWEGYDLSDATWEPHQNILDKAEIRKFEAERRARSQSRTPTQRPQPKKRSSPGNKLIPMSYLLKQRKKMTSSNPPRCKKKLSLQPRAAATSGAKVAKRKRATKEPAKQTKRGSVDRGNMATARHHAKRQKKRSGTLVPRLVGSDSTAENDEWSDVLRRFVVSSSLTSREKLQWLHSALHVSAVPQQLACRQRQHDEICDFVESRVHDQQGGSLYICGSPGTGKSLTIKTLRRSLIRGAQSNIGNGDDDEKKHELLQVIYPNVRIHMAYINAMALKEPKFLYPVLLEQLCRSAVVARYCDCSPADAQTMSPHDAADVLERLLTSSTAIKKLPLMHLVVIDELDGLLGRAQTVLYRLFEWCKKLGSSIILVGIANAMDLTDRFLPRLRARQCDPKVMIFPAYNNEELKNILVARLQDSVHSSPASSDEDAMEDSDETEYEANSVPYFAPGAIEICARKVASRSGDVRGCLNLCRQCLAQAMERLPTNDPNAKVPCIGVMDMMRMLSTLGSQHNDAMLGLPRHQQILLCILAAMSQSGHPEPSLAQVQQWYSLLAKKLHLPKVRSAEFVDISTALEVSGLVRFHSRGSKASSGRKCRLALCVQYEDVAFTFCKQPFLADILERGQSLVAKLK